MKKTKLPGIVTILILTLITAVVWVSLSVYRSFTTKPEPAVPENISKPITPTLDTTVIKSIVSAIFLNSTEIPDNVISGSPGPTIAPTIAPTVIATPTPIATTEATVSATPEATPVP